MKKLMMIFLCAHLWACSTMEFVNGPKMEDTVIREKWHHLGFNGLIEYSAPLDLDYVCDKQQWDSITIERTFVNGLAAHAYGYISVYSPWTITYECREPID